MFSRAGQPKQTNRYMADTSTLETDQEPVHQNAPDSSDLHDIEPYHNRIDIAKLREYITVKGLSERQAAKIMDTTKETVRYHIIKHGIPRKYELDDYKSNKADILAGKQQKLISNITPDRIEKANLRDIVWTFGVLYDKERLERGQSTGNIALSIDDMSATDQAALRKLADMVPDILREAEDAEQEGENGA